MSDYFKLVNSKLDDRNNAQGQEIWEKYWVIRNKKGKEYADRWLWRTKIKWVELLEKKEMRRIDKVSPGNDRTNESEKVIFDVARPKGHYISKKVKRK